MPVPAPCRAQGVYGGGAEEPASTWCLATATFCVEVQHEVGEGPEVFSIDERTSIITKRYLEKGKRARAGVGEEDND